MNGNPGNEDDAFDRFLREAVTPLPEDALIHNSGFRQEVWKRIQREEAGACATPHPRGWGRFFSFIGHPLSAATALIAAAALGLLLGALAPSHSHQDTDDRVAYARSISPFIHAAGAMRP